MEVLVSEDSGQGVRAHTQGRAGGEDQALNSGLLQKKLKLRGVKQLSQGDSAGK